MIKSIFALLTLILLNGCQTMSEMYLDRSKQKNPEITKPTSAQEERISDIQQMITNGKCAEAQISIQNFDFDFPHSTYTYALKYLSSECLIQNEKYDMAERKLREVIEYTLNTKPTLAAQSFLLLSYLYESQGDDSRALASALDAERLSTHLPIASRLAEVPARLAMLYSQGGNFQHAAEYLGAADEGIRVLKTQNPQTIGSQFWAKIYYMMGYKSTQQLGHDTISTAIQGLMAVQKFSLRSMEFSEPIWSTKSREALEKNYSALWSLATTPATQHSLSLLGDEYQIRQMQQQWLEEFLELVEQAQLYKPKVGAEILSSQSQEFFGFADILQKKIQQKILELARKTPLTEESKELNSPRRPGIVYPTQFFPNEDVQ